MSRRAGWLFAAGLALFAGEGWALAQTCGNGCAVAFDGKCDDGGPGSTTRACAFGSDCGDCGPRGSSSGGGGGSLRCTNACTFAFNGWCDDGGAGATTSACPFGSDCGDCGPRGAGGSSAASAGLFSGCGEPDDVGIVEVCENTCLSAFDGVCDEPEQCPAGSDCADCEPAELESAELGGCRSGSGASSTWWILALLALGLRLAPRRALLLLLLLAVAAPIGAARAQVVGPEAAAPEDRPLTLVSGSGLDLAYGVGAGAILGSEEGGASIGPRLRVSLHSAVAPTALVGLGVSAQVGLLIYRSSSGLDAEQLIGGRGHLDLFVTGCATNVGSAGTCVDAGGFVGFTAAEPVGPGAAGIGGAGAGPLLVFHAQPHLEGFANRDLRLELGWDLVRDLFEVRLGFELGGS